ncbi:aromatic ring-hydroxylating dioxygenase subunit alpha [Halieaceae bacterium IMCC14734]|uniref:Aromatic ring-hydroxylating dioxygenase subunit alpha n=1 Tax=Candidatus Litorirhabdus singularis TaxID=2518993 RepID=A0ABT3TCV9_9GAMM|nr:aromatic ring-hydroxylating dioxygenase subunit alpha [Candidatus Litorirhabdus singularis]MCX2980142.1 aromatic ring-hydroxylating dioxygenase subunit alpha [Candidatus Litorirhabdus singularis]
MNEKIKLTPEQIAARNPSWNYQDLLDGEVNAVPDALRASTEPYLGSDNIPIERWTSREFYDLEVEKMWSKTWQMACRESHIANPGDYHVYDVAKYSILVVRNEAGEIKAHHNSCLHRGRALKRGTGTDAKELRCPYHGFTWSLDGDFVGAPCQWDFPHVDEDNFALPAVKTATWGGWVFINMDPDAQELEEYMGILPEHFKRWPAERRYVAMHVQKVINANWKAVVEAFIESYHALVTHPQLLPYQGIENSQYDVWGDNVSRTITSSGTINPSHEDEYTQADSVAYIAGADSALVGETEAVTESGDDMLARDVLANKNYADFSEQAGEDLREYSTKAELMDAILYLLFPNFAPWAGYGPVLTYRHRPNGNDHKSCVMDIFILAQYPEGEERPADATTVRLEAEQPFSDAEEVMGAGLARVFDQDGSNLPQVQRGMEASAAGEVVLGNYQEVRIRQFHRTLDKYLNA